MKHDIFSLFHGLGDVDIPPDMEGRVRARVFSEIHREVRRTVFFARFGVFFSATAFLYSLANYGGAIFASDFWSMMTLLFSDASLVAVHWEDFVLSLFETFPVSDFVFILVPAFLFFLCLNLYARILPRRSYRYSV